MTGGLVAFDDEERLHLQRRDPTGEELVSKLASHHNVNAATRPGGLICITESLDPQERMLTHPPRGSHSSPGGSRTTRSAPGRSYVQGSDPAIRRSSMSLDRSSAVRIHLCAIGVANLVEMMLGVALVAHRVPGRADVRISLRRAPRRDGGGRVGDEGVPQMSPPLFWTTSPSGTGRW